MRAIAWIVLVDVGLLRTISRRMTPVSAARLEEVTGPAISPVSTKRVDMDGIPYVYFEHHRLQHLIKEIS